MLRRLALALIPLAMLSSMVKADDKKSGYEFFETRIRPVLVEHCQECHTGDEPESGLSVDSLAELVRGGTRGPAIIPGDPKKSLLILAVNHADQQLHMPPKKKLPTRTLADLAQWIKMGAPWTDSKAVKAASSAAVSRYKITDKERQFWAFQPPQRPQLPKVHDPAWAQNSIDYFVLARLEAAGLQPAKRADRRKLIRRATLDLTGLLPTPEEVDAFLRDRSATAYEQLIDRLLNSPQYGERWGRHWLDVARYADSNGLDENLAYANAFRFRDYVVKAFNTDKPYNRFVVEQIAGDRLGDDDPVPSGERITATGFLTLGAKMLAEDDPTKMQMDIIDEQVDTVGRAFMALTLGCARCHDHKFDPIPTADYYSLAGIFKSTKTMENFKVVAVWQERPVGDPVASARREALQREANAAQARIDKLVAAENEKVQVAARANAGNYFRAATQQLQLQKHADKLLAAGKGPVAKDADAIAREAEKFERGNLSRLSDGYGKGIGVIAGPGGRNHAEFDIQVKRTGWYFLVSRYAAAESRPTNFSVNGSMVITGGVQHVTGSWYPDTQKWFVEGAVWLKAGKAVFALERQGPIPHIDKLVFVPAPSDYKNERPANLHSSFVSQWADYLRQSEKDADSPLALWHHVAAGKSLSELKATTAKAVLSELGLPGQPTIGQVSESIAKAFDRAEQEWRALLRKDPAAKQLRSAGLQALKTALYDDKGPLRTPADASTLYDKEVRQTINDLTKSKAATMKRMPATPVAMAVSDAKAENVKIHIRGSHVTLGQQVPRQFPQVLAPSRRPLSDNTSGRLELARWMTRPQHPLTSRVMVNRVWLWHFGKALVRSPDNFGRLGERPTHPQLLDYLSRRLIEHDWSLKDLHRTIMLSATYQMATTWNKDAGEKDPENRLLWRMNRRRMEAEVIRDSLLSVGQSVDLQMGGSLLPNKNREYVTSSGNVNPAVYQNQRRSIYLPVVRSALFDVFQAFDFADPTVLNGTRQATTIAPQALFMMNSEFVAKQTGALAGRLLAEDMDDSGRIAALYERVFSRPPTAAETAQALKFVSRYQQLLISRKQKAADSRRLAWQGLCRAIVSTNEFMFID